MVVTIRTFPLRLCALVGLVTLWAVSAASTGPVTPVASGLTPSWRFTPTATNDTLIVVDVVDRDVVWAAGGGFQGATGDGSVVRSVDGGRSWRNVTPPGGAVDEFRDVEAFDRDHALVLTLSSATEPPRIYRTADGGASWQLVFRDPDPEAFYSCMAFFDDRRGLAVGDPAGGRFPIQTTADGGRTWHPAPTGSLPVAQPGDGALATGTCMAAQGPRDAWFATTGTRSEPTRSPQVFHTRDGGRTWSVADTPIPGATSAIASLSFLDRRRGLAVGGNFAPPQGVDVGAAARTVDGGAAWFAGRAPAGFRNSVAWVPSRADTAVAVGPGGSDVSTNGGRTWEQFDHTLLLGVNCAPHAGCWAVGENGLAARLVLTHH